MLGLLRRRPAGPKSELKALLGSYRLPSFDASVIETLRLLRDDASTGTQIAGQIERDPGLHLSVLRTVNSAAFGLQAKVASIPQAVNLLGRARLEPLVLAIGVRDALPADAPHGFDSHRFWHRSAVRATAAREFARLLHPGTQDQAFAAGLLLDLGVPVLVTAKGPDYLAIYNAEDEDEENAFNVREQRLLGYDHTSAGALIAKEWALPSYLAHAVEKHHDPTPDLDPAIQLAALICDQDEHDDVQSVALGAAGTFGLSEAEIAEVLAFAFAEAGSFAGMAG